VTASAQPASQTAGLRQSAYHEADAWALLTGPAVHPRLSLPTAHWPVGQHRDLPEWLDYHRRLGVSHFYVMDDSSDPPLDDLLRPYIEASAPRLRQLCP
jgi:hypothetical protein